jgi:DNA-binding beta-propeller fold protein YncE
VPGQKLEVNGSIKLSAGSGGGLIFADGTVLTSAQGAIGPQGPAGATGATGPPGSAPGHIVLLQWWSSVAYSVGNSPQGVAFDGTNIWVTTQNDNGVSKIPAF